MNKILLINGPNLNLLGSREPETYGANTLEDIVEECQKVAKREGLTLTSFQSNSENEIVDTIQSAPSIAVDYIIINPAAFTHTSVAIRDALLAVAIPFIEIHISNITARESFRTHSYFSDIADGTICGFGVFGYTLAIKAASNKIRN
jgi:3-dehydroquinate dehydratase-2